MKWKPPKKARMDRLFVVNSGHETGIGKYILDSEKWPMNSVSFRSFSEKSHLIEELIILSHITGIPIHKPPK